MKEKKETCPDCGFSFEYCECYDDDGEENE